MNPSGQKLLIRTAAGESVEAINIDLRLPTMHIQPTEDDLVCGVGESQVSLLTSSVWYMRRLQGVDGLHSLREVYWASNVVPLRLVRSICACYM